VRKAYKPGGRTLFRMIPAHSQHSTLSAPFAPRIINSLGESGLNPTGRNPSFLRKTVRNGRNYQHPEGRKGHCSEGFKRHSPKDGRRTMRRVINIPPKDRRALCASYLLILPKTEEHYAPHSSHSDTKTGEHYAPHSSLFSQRRESTMRLILS